MLLWMMSFLYACGGGGGDGGNSACDMVANPKGPAYFKVTKQLGSGLEWFFRDSYAFGAEMKPGECVKMGVAASQYIVEFQQCNIGSDGGCASTFGPSKMITFSVSSGKTYALSVDDGFFQ